MLSHFYTSSFSQKTEAYYNGSDPDNPTSKRLDPDPKTVNGLQFITRFPVSHFLVPAVFGNFWKSKVQSAIFKKLWDIMKFGNSFVQIIVFLKLVGYFTVKHKIGLFLKSLGPKL